MPRDQYKLICSKKVHFDQCKFWRKKPTFQIEIQ